jgi:hypothetical protein
MLNSFANITPSNAKILATNLIGTKVDNINIPNNL